MRIQGGQTPWTMELQNLYFYEIGADNAVLFYFECKEQKSRPEIFIFTMFSSDQLSKYIMFNS